MKKYISIIIFTIVIMLSIKVNAAGTISLSSGSSEVKVGDEFSISVNLSGASVATLTTRLSIDTSKVQYVSGPSNTNYSNGKVIYTWTDPTGGENPKTSGTIATFKFKAKQAGKASFSISGDFYNSNEEAVNPSFVGTSITIKEKVTETPPTDNNTNNNNNTGGNTGGNNPSNNTTNNNTNNNPSATVSSNANLKSLQIDVEGLNPKFNKNTLNYYITVPSSVQNIKVTAVPEDASASVDISGNKNLKIGTNKINIKVIAANNKTTKNYVINVSKTDNVDLTNANLENLAIENAILNPEFNADITEYTTTVESTVESLNILAVPQIEGAKVEIKGKDNLQFGENEVLINVTSKDGSMVKLYKVTVHRNTAEEENKEETVNEINENINMVENTNNEDLNNVFNNIGFILIIVISYAGVIYMIIRKYVKEKQK